ncbi:MAG: hypothetical protein V4642_03150 [Bacteroidota bacterium]
MITNIIQFISGLPTFMIVILAVIVFGIVFAIFRRLIKFALSLAALTILVLVIIKLLEK